MNSAVIHSSRHPRNLSLGFTLIELVVTIAVAGILLAVAVPALRTFLQNDRLLTEANSLVWSLDLARSEAIKQDAALGVQVCASANGTTCDGQTSNTWANGWIVFVPSAVAPNPAVLQVVPALPSGSTLKEKVAGAGIVTFLSSGQTNPGGAPAVAFTLCDDRGATQARYVQVQSTGRVASSAKGVDLNNNALTCP